MVTLDKVSQNIQQRQKQKYHQNLLKPSGGEHNIIRIFQSHPEENVDGNKSHHRPHDQIDQ